MTFHRHFLLIISWISIASAFNSKLSISHHSISVNRRIMMNIPSFGDVSSLVLSSNHQLTNTIEISDHISSTSSISSLWTSLLEVNNYDGSIVCALLTLAMITAALTTTSSDSKDDIKQQDNESKHLPSEMSKTLLTFTPYLLDEAAKVVTRSLAEEKVIHDEDHQRLEGEKQHRAEEESRIEAVRLEDNEIADKEEREAATITAERSQLEVARIAAIKMNQERAASRIRAKLEEDARLRELALHKKRDDEAIAAAAQKAKLEYDAQLRELASQQRRDDEAKAIYDAKLKIEDDARQRSIALQAKKEGDLSQRRRSLDDARKVAAMKAAADRFNKHAEEQRKLKEREEAIAAAQMKAEADKKQREVDEAKRLREMDEARVAAQLKLDNERKAKELEEARRLKEQEQARIAAITKSIHDKKLQAIEAERHMKIYEENRVSTEIKADIDRKSKENDTMQRAKDAALPEIKKDEDIIHRKKRDVMAGDEKKLRVSKVAARAQEILSKARESSQPMIRLPHTNTIDPSSSTSTLIIPVGKTQPSLLSNIKNVMTTFGIGKPSLKREDIAKLGLNVLLSYGFVSNVSYVSCIISAWLAHGKRTGLSPLVPGQWKSFLAIYVGFWAANNLIRPLRFSLSIALSPYFERFVAYIQKKTQCSRSTAIAAVVFLVNVCGTLTFLFGGLIIATTVAGVPLLP